MKKTFIFYPSFMETVETIPQIKYRYLLLESIIKLGSFIPKSDEELTTFIQVLEQKLSKNPQVLGMFFSIKPQILANLDKFLNGCKGAEYGALGAEYGKLGGRPKKPPKNPPKEKGIKNKEEGIRNKEEGIRNKEEGVRNKEEGVKNKVSFSSFKKEKKEKSLNFSFEKKEDFEKTFNSFCENSFNFPSENQAFRQEEPPESAPLKQNEGELCPNAPILEDFEGSRGQIVPPFEEEKQATTNCHGLDKGELCPNEGQPLRNPKQLPQNQRPKWDRNPDIMLDANVTRVFEIYKKECKNLLPIGYENRDMAYRGKIKEFLDVISGDFAYFTDVCRKANELKVIMLKKIDLKMLINCHARISSGFYNVEKNSNKDETMTEFLNRKKRETENAK